MSKALNLLVTLLVLTIATESCFTTRSRAMTRSQVRALAKALARSDAKTQAKLYSILPAVYLAKTQARSFPWLAKTKSNYLVASALTSYHQKQQH